MDNDIFEDIPEEAVNVIKNKYKRYLRTTNNPEPLSLEEYSTTIALLGSLRIQLGSKKSKSTSLEDEIAKLEAKIKELSSVESEIREIEEEILALKSSLE